ncbi:MAG: rRNA maturation RNAse YbeY, partial [Clostridia bacterium]|nr:rRNA maturation RNAse YbeY [Clostridia bacterium]
MNRCHVSFTNQQCKERTPKVLKDLIRSAVNAVLEYEGVLVESEMSVLLVDDRGIRELNRDFRNIDRATDVLSFPSGDYPLEDGAECTRITIWGQPDHTYKLGTGTEWCFANHRKKTTEERFPDDLTFSFEKDAIVMRSNTVHPFPELYAFTAQEGIAQRSREIKTMPLTTIREHIAHYLVTEKEITTDPSGKAEDRIIV